MNTLLIFFALPIATIIISIALQKILKCPPLVASIIFAIFLIVTFIVNNLNFLVVTIVYTILSFITATIVCLICNFTKQKDSKITSCFSGCCLNNMNTQNNNVITIEDICPDTNRNNDIITISGNANYQNQNNSNECSCRNNNCNSQNTSNNCVSARVNVIPNANTNGRTGCICGRYRRR